MSFDASIINLLYALPFFGVLLSISLGPTLFTSWWHRAEKPVLMGWVLLALLPLFVRFGGVTLSTEIAHTLLGHYLPFMVLIGALFVLCGGIHISMKGHATPLMNVSFLLGGGILSNIIGTTGASMLLIRPLLALNHHRRRNSHVVLFFIFFVANISGCLTPIGDPPLFLGFLEGVDFFWPLLHHYQPLLLVGSLLLTLFWAVDHYFFYHDPKIPDPAHAHSDATYKIQGKRNIPLLFLVILVVILTGQWAHPAADFVREGALILIALIGWWITPGQVRHYNRFTWAPLQEVGVVFFAIFMTMMPVMPMLKQGADGVFAPLMSLANPNGTPDSATYFWLTGSLSAVLDNAPTYLAFFYAAGGDAQHLMWNIPHVLQAISLGAVFMGALTYIGNAPNYMIRSIAEKSGVRMPSFFGYALRSSIILLPLFYLFQKVFLS